MDHKPLGIIPIQDIVREGDSLAFTVPPLDFKKGDPITIEDFGEVKFFEVEEVEYKTEHELRLRLKALKDV